LQPTRAADPHKTDELIAKSLDTGNHKWIEFDNSVLVQASYKQRRYKFYRRGAA